MNNPTDQNPLQPISAADTMLQNKAAAVRQQTDVGILLWEQFFVGLAVAAGAAAFNFVAATLFVRDEERERRNTRGLDR